MTADKRACPDVDLVKESMDESFEELRLAVGVERIERIEIEPRAEVRESIPMSSGRESHANAENPVYNDGVSGEQERQPEKLTVT